MEHSRFPFQVIEGGLARSTTPNYQKFKDAWITDTRLMGVIAMGIHWQRDGGEPKGALYQYFYFDAEELGFDRYGEADGTDPAARADLEASFIGGLGGEKVPITLPEAVHLLRKYIRYNQKYGIPMPVPETGYRFLLSMGEDLSEEEETRLLRKACVPVNSRNMLANYFLMRSFGKDFEAARLISAPGVARDLTPELSLGVLHKNKVMLTEDRSAANCESLLECENGYYLISTHLEFDGEVTPAEDTPPKPYVSSCQVFETMRISDKEAFMTLSHSEFVSVYQYDGDPRDFRRGIAKILNQAEIIEEHQGRTFMVYHPDNEHVRSDTYYLYNDLVGFCHMGDNGELILVSNTLKGIRTLEINIHFSELPGELTQIYSFEFNQPVMIQYLQSSFASFEEFLDVIRME